MNKKHYKLRFLPLFENDLNEIIDYITIRLKNLAAAKAFINEVQTAIYERVSCAESFEPYNSSRNRENTYYRIYVKNYTIFYVVIGDAMEVRRIVYSRRNL